MWELSSTIYDIYISKESCEKEERIEAIVVTHEV